MDNLAIKHSNKSFPPSSGNFGVKSLKICWVCRPCYASRGCPSLANDVASVNPATRNYINLAAHVTNHYGLFKIGQHLMQSHILPNFIFNQKAFIQLLLSWFECLHSWNDLHFLFSFHWAPTTFQHKLASQGCQTDYIRPSSADLISVLNYQDSGRNL